MTEHLDIEPSPLEPNVRYIPFSQYDDVFQQLSTLRSMGYPVEMTIISNQDEEMHQFFAQYKNDDTMQTEGPLYQQWVKFVIDPDFNEYIELPDAPGDLIVGDDPRIQELLEGHPIQLIHDIDMGNVSMLHYKFCRMQEGDESYMRLIHERDDFPWSDLLGRAIVTAKIRYDEFNERDDTFRLRSTNAEADLFAAQLIALGVQPLNGEQLSGIVSDYYQFVEKNIPGFKEFKSATK